jgi:hypothetical protein
VRVLESGEEKLAVLLFLALGRGLLVNGREQMKQEANDLPGFMFPPTPALSLTINSSTKPHFPSFNTSIPQDCHFSTSFNICQPQRADTLLGDGVCPS